MPRAYRAHDFIKEQPLQLLLMKVDHQAFGVLLQPVILVQTFHRYRRRKIDSNNFQQILEAYLICNKAEVEKRILQILNAPKHSSS